MTQEDKITKQLLIFDIDNLEKDYSAITESILLLEEGNINGFLDVWGKSLKGKVSRVPLKSNPIVRYYECPMKIPESDSTGSILSGAEEVEQNYSQIFRTQYWEEQKEECLQFLKKLCVRNGSQFLRIGIPQVIFAKLQEQKKRDRATLKNAICNRQVYYHIRVRVNMEALCDLQYLALALKKLNGLLVDKRISVLLISSRVSVEYFPFCDISMSKELEQLKEDHRIFSQYLRLLSKKATGIIYAPYANNLTKATEFNLSILPMDFQVTARGSNFFPLIEVENMQYRELFGTNALAADRKKSAGQSIPQDGKLSAVIQEENLYQKNGGNRNKNALFQTGPLRFMNANSPNPQEAFLAFVAETAWKQLEWKWNNEDKNQHDITFLHFRKIILDLFTGEKNNWLSFAIFAFLIEETEGGHHTETRLRESYKIAREISLGIQQLMQNAIQHSEFHSCFFTFYLDAFTKKLRLFVSDTNTSNTIIESFKNRLREEMAACNTIQNSDVMAPETIDWTLFVKEHAALVASNQIKLAHFFNVFEKTPGASSESDIQLLWRKFRQSDSTAHIGMMIFYQTVIHSRADLILQSTRNYQISHADGEFFSCKEGKVAEDTKSTPDMKRVLPGTQYLISIPVGKHWSAPTGGAHISGIRSFCEDYRTFSSFVDFVPKELDSEIWVQNRLDDLLVKAKKYSVTESTQKFHLQLLWTGFWHQFISELIQSHEENTVFVWRTTALEDYLSNADHAETFLKGMFAALNSHLIAQEPLYLAILNVQTSFLDCLRSVSISLVNRAFPHNIQLYFIDSSCQKHIQIFGNSVYEAVINAVELGIEHDSDSFRLSDTFSARQLVSLPSSKFCGKPIAVMPFDAIIKKNTSSNHTLFDEYMSSLLKYRLDSPEHHGYKLEDTHMRLGSKVHIHSFYEMSFLFYRTTIANRTAFQILRSYSRHLLDKIHARNYTVEPVLFYSYASYSKAILTSLVEMSRVYLEQTIRSLLGKDGHKVAGNSDEVQKIIERATAQIGFASYQHNLQSESTHDSIQLYFGLSKDYSGGSLTRQNGSRHLILKQNVDVVQIVPISSTLTTFDKMYSKLKSHINDRASLSNRLVLSANYTALWVCDGTDMMHRQCGRYLKPSTVEEDYWCQADILQQTIKVKQDAVLNELNDCPQVTYFIRESAIWERPIFCSLCFPENDKLLLEVPLVKTDLTSTVPAQQVRENLPANLLSIDEKKAALKKKKMDTQRNNERLLWLQDCVYYGHIKRGKNHHQYFLNTQDFFYKDQVQRAVKEWLQGLRKERSDEEPKLKIIFSPEHNTNVGFAQYVNTYYFEGSAEVISINEDKVFRSNFICEHEMLRRTIERVHMQSDVFGQNMPVQFYFVDDTINTGATLHKANSLIRSLLPMEYVSLYPAFLFKNCFLLVDRMSNATKSAYVASGQVDDFLSFVHIDISNMRVYGDSCVGCKLQKETKRLFKRSASPTAANYWAKKYMRLAPIDYDDLNEMDTRKTEPHAYERLLLSHITQNYIFSDGILTREPGAYYDCILTLFDVIFRYRSTRAFSIEIEKKGFLFESLICELLKIPYDGQEERRVTIKKQYTHQKRLIAELLMKLLARPFFSFDSSFRSQMLSFLLGIAECILRWYTEGYELAPKKERSKWYDECVLSISAMIPQGHGYKGFLHDNDRIKKTVSIAEQFIQSFQRDILITSHFFMDVLFEALADMHSTYLLRKSVIIRVNQFVDQYLYAPHGDVSARVSAVSCKECPYLLDKTQCMKNNWADNCFWITYCAHVQRILDSTNDEVRAAWFSYFLFSGDEIEGQDESQIMEKLISTHDNFPGITQLISCKGFPVAAEFLLSTAVTEFDIMERIVETNDTTNYALKHYFHILRWLDQQTGTFQFYGTDAAFADREDQSSNEAFTLTLKRFFSTLDQSYKETYRRDLQKNILKTLYAVQQKVMPNAKGDRSVAPIHELQFVGANQRFGGYKVPHAREQYQEFLDGLVEYLSYLNRLEKDAFNVALLTMSKDEEIASNDKMQIIESRFGQDATANRNERRSKYIIKDRVVRAFNQMDTKPGVIGVLKETGYHICFASDVSKREYEQTQQEIKYDGEHHILGDHRKPYLVLFFDNPDFDHSSNRQMDTELGRKLVPLNHVFLYVSIEINEVKRRNKIPWVILRDILTFRNRIMSFLTRDFNSDLMQEHAASLQEEIILTQERSVSHASTTDDKGILRTFGLSSISPMKVLTYPVDSETKLIIDDESKPSPQLNSYSSSLWLLLQNYTNGQIARLFSRQFNNQDKELVKREGIPPLYLSKEDEQKEDIFKQCLVCFEDIHILPETNPEDNRFALLRKAAYIYCAIDPGEQMYFNERKREYYNAEYMRCVLLDIIFSSLKYATVNESLLPRIDNLIFFKKRQKEQEDGLSSKRVFHSSIESHIFMFKSECFLVILNNVKPNALIEDIPEINEEIYRRIHDVLDYGDGHMSLFTIRQFVLRLRLDQYIEDSLDVTASDVSFRYRKEEAIEQEYRNQLNMEEFAGILRKYDTWFETKLPIFKEGRQVGKQQDHCLD